MQRQEKQKKIVQMFNEIAPTYDKANRILSMGIDISWRKKACDIAFKKYNQKNIPQIVDVACGTGDMMHFWNKEASKNSIEIEKIIGIDPSFGMIEVAKKKFPNFNFIISTATDIPLEDSTTDILSISYGIRNVVDRQKAFDEFARVVKKGGYVVILEFTKDNKQGILHTIKRFYINNILPFIGGIISKNYKAYKYLPDSIDGFLTSDMLQNELKNSGFKTEYVKGFSMNISTLLVARRC